MSRDAELAALVPASADVFLFHLEQGNVRVGDGRLRIVRVASGPGRHSGVRWHGWAGETYVGWRTDRVDLVQDLVA